MKAVRPFGDLATATILVIGHDPRLQRSQAEAEAAFFTHTGDVPLTQSQPSITCTTHILPFDKLSPCDLERLCLWPVEREGY